MIRYAVNGSNLPSAFAPPPVSSVERAFGGSTRVTGYLAMPIPVQRPEEVWVPTPNDAPDLQPSNTSPPEMHANMYVVSMAGQGPQVNYANDQDYYSPLPIPTIATPRRVAPQHKRARVGGKTATAAPKVVQRWPVFGGGSSANAGQSC